jgi:hypothetical protein
MNASERLQAGRTATYEERFEEALGHFLWFHDHALEEDAAFSGVRLSFALAYWLELAEKYAPAMDAFRARRDAKIAILQAGQLNRSLFHDVEAMNERLDEDETTATLFALIHAQSPEFARECARIALPMLVRTKRFDLAREYMPDPKTLVERLVQDLLLDIGEIEDRPRTKTPRFRAFVHIFADDLRDVLAILRATGASRQATRLKQRALGSIKLKYIKNAVIKHLSAA